MRSTPADDKEISGVTAAVTKRFELVETMLWQNGIALESLHLDRIAASASHFGWSFDRASAAELLARNVETLQQNARFEVCMRLSENGNLLVRTKRFVPPERHGCVRLAKHVTAADDLLRRHQTTCRELYDRLFSTARREGLDDLIFSNERGELTEGAVHSFFIKCGGKLLTPPIDCGVLPGVYRRYVLETNCFAEEQVLRPRDLQSAQAIYLTNSLVGMYPVQFLT